MNVQVDRKVFFGVIAAAVVIAGFFIWRAVAGGANSTEAFEREQLAKAEVVYKEKGLDIRKDPRLGPVYYKYHPNETPDNSMKALSNEPLKGVGGRVLPPPSSQGQGNMMGQMQNQPVVSRDGRVLPPPITR